jgi:hypothetical protein
MFELGQTVPPVFVDVSGRRRRRIRWLAYAIGFAVLMALLVVWLSQLVGTVRPDPATPCPPAASAAHQTTAPAGRCTGR